MKETWIRPNRRAIYMTLGLYLAAALVGLVLLSGLISTHWVLRLIGGLLVAAGAFASFGILIVGTIPRLAYEDGQLLVYLQGTEPLSVPIDKVEVFFVGQSDSKMPDDDAESSTVVVRLAEAAEDLHFREVKPNLGHWCDGYITIRGTWCEPINKDLIHRLNGRLIEVHREQRAKRSAAASDEVAG